MMKTKLLLMLVAIALVAGTAQANMLVNPGFEDGIFVGGNPLPDFWFHYPVWYTHDHTWVEDPCEAHSGVGYMKMYNWLASNTEWHVSGYLGQTVLGVTEDGDYTFTVWAKNAAEDQANEAGIHCDWIGLFSQRIGSDFVAIPVTNPDWINLDFGTLTAPKGAVAAEIWLVAPLGNGLNAICYDDVSLLGPDPNVHAGPDMISWVGETVSLPGNYSLAGEYSTITWTAEPAGGALITDGGSTLTPTVQINDLIIGDRPEATIANHSFENGLDNWTTLTGAEHGTWNGYTDGTVYITPADGFMCAYLDGVTGGEAGTLSQVLANNLLAAVTTYTLTVEVVNDGYYEENVGYGVQLLAGETVIAEDDDEYDLDTYGEWETSTVTYATGATHPELGLPLEIRLVAKDGTNKITFDNVHLTASPPFPPHEPDFHTYKLTLDVDGKYDVMKIDVYPDACAAKLGMGREATDVVGDDCITDLADLDEMVKTWAVDNTLTEPLTKPKQKPVTGGGIVILNAGFENPELADGTWVWAPEWDLNDGEIYVANPSDDLGGNYYDCFGGIAPEGQNVGISGAYKGDESGLVQVLTETLATNLVYELIVEVGRTPIYSWIGYKVQLLAGGTILAEDDNSLVPLPDTFETSIVTYDSTGADMRLLGGHLEIRLIGLAVKSYLEIIFDDVRLTATAATGPRDPSPSTGAYIDPVSELELSWTNAAPFEPNDPEVVYDPNGPVWVDVWFGTDPNNYNDFNKIVNAVEDANSVTVDVSTPRIYYWQVNSYIYGDPADVIYDTSVTDPNSATGVFPIVKGSVWRFHAATDVPVLVEAGDMITWSGQATQLDPNIDDDGESDVTYLWSAEPAAGVVASIVFDPNEYVEDPTVTITKDFRILSIANHSFEDLVRADGVEGDLWSWTVPDVGARIFNPGETSGYIGYEGVAPDGENVLWVNGVGAASQVLADTLTADSTYTLSVWVGCNGYYPGSPYKVELLAGGIVLAADDNSIKLKTDVFEFTTVTYNSGTTPAQLGEPLEIRLWCTKHIDFGGESNFDDVHLTVEPERPFSDAVSTVKLTVEAHDDAGFDKDTMTIDVYDTACSAAIVSVGQETISPGDFDADCDTDFKDFATMAKEWLVNNELTESVSKP